MQIFSSLKLKQLYLELSMRYILMPVIQETWDFSRMENQQ